jgi:hypothetical protein
VLFYLLLAGSLTVAGAGLAYVGLALMAVAMFYVPVAVYWARGRPRAGLGLVAAAGIAGAVGGQALAPAMMFALYAAAGIVPGIALACRWRYGTAVAATTGAVFALLLMEVMRFWDAFKASGYQARDSMVAFSRLGSTGRSAADQQTALEAANAMAEAWPYMGVGAIFFSLLIGCCIFVGALRLVLQRMGYLGALPGSFVAMRPPDTLVWAVIGAALLWYWDYRWPQEAVRLLSWNALTGLAGVYAVNGIGIVLHGVRALKAPRVLAGGAVVLALLYAPYFVIGIGLFDTWGAFRTKFDKLAHMREVRKQQDDDSWQ